MRAPKPPSEKAPGRGRFWPAVLWALCLAAPAVGAGEKSADAGAAAPQRIVSLAPSLTETLFELGLGDRVVGVTDYCNFPPEVKKIKSVGGYVTPSFEAVAALRPDLLLLLPEHKEVKHNLEAMKVPILEVENRTVRAVLDSFRAIGRAAGAEARGNALSDGLQRRLDRIAGTVAGRPRPRVLLCVARRMTGAGGIGEIRVGAPGSFHGDLLAYAGADNAVPSGLIFYPEVSAEGLLKLDPDVIVELEPNAPADKVRVEWSDLSSLRAVRTGRVLVFTQDFLAIPGPRLMRFIEDLARALHPEAPWKP